MHSGPQWQEVNAKGSPLGRHCLTLHHFHSFKLDFCLQENFPQDGIQSGVLGETENGQYSCVPILFTWLLILGHFRFTQEVLKRKKNVLLLLYKAINLYEQIARSILNFSFITDANFHATDYKQCNQHGLSVPT